MNMRSIVGRDLTGVQRYGLEIYKRLDNLIPLDAPEEFKDGIKGHVWDQLTLPIRVRGLLWSPANLGPILVKDQVLTIHDMSPFDHPEWFDSKYLKLNRSIQPLLVQTVKHIITVSEYSKARIIANFGIEKDKISVTHLAADKKFYPLDEASRGKTISKFSWPERYILCVGSLENRKNLKNLFYAWSNWGNRPKDIKLLVGGGEGKVFSSIGFNDLPEGIVLLGRVPDDILPSLYRCATAFVYPSLYEGFGLPVLEAMSSGVPVLSSNTTSIPEIAGDSAILVNPYKPQEIVKSLQNIIESKDLRDDLIGKGLARTKMFSWDITAEKTRTILEEKAAK
jgi:glycosyltransferase involved in cell wall biosynthesis